MSKTKNAIQVKCDDFRAILKICGSDFLIGCYCSIKNLWRFSGNTSLVYLTTRIITVYIAHTSRELPRIAFL